MTRIFQGLKVCYGFDAGDASRHPVEPVLCGVQVSVYPPHSRQRRIHAPGCQHSSRISGAFSIFALVFFVCFQDVKLSCNVTNNDSYLRIFYWYTSR
jgi:hypothetical protein